MAEEAFALSPISARPNVPGEADYDAIREAFMETARGRWFLNEYAKRNRHTDTGMVLEAVARIEASLKAQKQAAVVTLSESLGAIRSVVRQAKATAIESLPRTDDDTLTGARNGARIVREIAWTLRECGADVRICDLLDTQVKAIDAAQQSAGGEGRDAVLASYDLLMQHIEALADGSAAATARSEAPPADETPAQPAEARTSVTPLFKTPEPVVEKVVTPDPVAEPALVGAEAAIEEPSAGIAATVADIAFDEAAHETAIVEPEAAAREAEAHDLAVLDMVAMEMAVQDVSEPETAELNIAEPDATATAADVAPPTPIAEVAPAPQSEPTDHPSLGAALIANGVISNPNAPAGDPLAPIRRMTQAEKIAFFS